MHLSDEHVERLLHQELEGSTVAAAREHMAICRECRHRLDQAADDERRVFALLETLDHDVPRVDVARLIARAQPRQPQWYRWAAGLLLAVSAAGAAYAAPGSPVASWVRSLWVRLPTPAGIPAPTPAPTAAPAPMRGVALGGLALTPGVSLLIEFRAERPGSALRVLRTDGPVVLIQGPASAATFTSAAGRVVIDHATTDSVTFDLQIPRSAPRVEVRVAGRQVFLQVGRVIETASPTLPDGGYLLALDGVRR